MQTPVWICFAYRKAWLFVQLKKLTYHKVLKAIRKWYQ